MNEEPATSSAYISGYPDEAIAHHGIVEEGITLLEKPFSLQELAGLVRRLLDEDGIVRGSTGGVSDPI